MSESTSQFWYCLKHKTVEGRDGCRNADRLGPYDTAADAARAVEMAAERTQAWDQDPDWNDDAKPSPTDGDVDGR